MRTKTISVIALSNRDFDCLESKLREAAKWIEIAGHQGSDLVVLPENINRFCGDGAGNPRFVPAHKAAFRDWRTETEIVIAAAQEAGVTLALPVLHWEDDILSNSFFLLSPEGHCVGQYRKACPTPGELDSGMRPEKPSLMEWQGIRLGGAICFDTCFPEVISAQADAGAELILVPSLWPGGRQLNHYARHYSIRFAVAYPAWSRIIDIDGEEPVAGGYRHETLRFGFGAPVYTTTLNFDRVALFGNHNQEKIVEILQKYGERIRITFDQDNVLFFLESLDPKLSEQDILSEFQLIPAHQYFANCRERYRGASGSPGPASCNV